MIIEVEMYEKIRYMHSVEKISQRAIAAQLNISRNTVKKYCDGAYVPWDRKQYYRQSPVVNDDVIDFILQCLHEDELEGVKKQQHTAKRIYDRLVDEIDFAGGESTIRRIVCKLKEKPAQAFIPLAFDPGEAVQVDWGNAIVYLNGIRTKVKLFCMRLCFSCSIFVMAFPRENEEAFLEGHITAFQFFGGVSRRLIFDNAKVAVKEGFGVFAKEQARFAALKAHYAFTTDFCNPAQGHEKGLVENLVGWIRRNALVPIPRVKDYAELNRVLIERCLKYQQHQIKNRSRTVGEDYLIDKAQLLPIPIYAFDPSRCISVKVDDFGTVPFDGNHYSVPLTLVGKETSVKGLGSTVKVFYRGEEVSCFPRQYGKGHTEYKLEHYLDILELRPRAVLNAKPVKALIAEPMLAWAKQLPGGNRDIVKFLRLVVDYGHDKVAKAITDLGNHLSPHLDLLRTQLIHKSSNVVPMPVLQHEIKVKSPDLNAYDRLLNTKAVAK